MQKTKLTAEQATLLLNNKNFMEGTLVPFIANAAAIFKADRVAAEIFGPDNCKEALESSKIRPGATDFCGKFNAFMEEMDKIINPVTTPGHGTH